MNNNRLVEDKNSLKPMIALFKAHKSLIEFVKNDIKETGFDLNEFSVLEVIYHKKKIDVSSIKEKVLVANSSLSYILDKLLKKGLITRSKCQEDKRINYIELSSEGENICEEIFSNHYDKLKKTFNILTKDEKDILVILLKKIGMSV